MTTANLDIFDPDLYAVGVPHDRFERLRREAPISWHKEPGGPGFWAVTKHRDVLRVSKDATLFSSEVGGTQIPDLPRHDIRVSPDNLAVMDPPRHTRYRALIGQSFTPSGLSKMEGYVRQRVASLVDDLVRRRTFEFMEEFAARLPMAIILEMVGVPVRDEEMIKRWIVQLLAPDDPEYQSSEEARGATTERFMKYAHDLAAERRRAPQDDLLSRLMSAEVDGMRLSYSEFGMFFMLLLAAGTHTSHLTLGNGALALMEHPEERARLIANPDMAANAVEEILRWSPPIMHFRRTATRDTELRGQKILAGQKVVVWYASANRDDEVFANPHAFDIGREIGGGATEHLSFGHGPHFCVGNAMARMSIRIALGECFRQMPGMSLDGRPERLRSNWFNGMKRMPVSVNRAS
jgi:cytochrome P450